MPKARDGFLARSICYTRQHTTVFERAPVVSGSAAVLLGNVTNNAQAEIELAVGGVEGRLAVFKAGHSTSGPYCEASGLGTLSALGLGKLFLGYGDDQQQLIACTEEGVCHIFNVRPSDVKWDTESDIGRVAPVWSVTCPRNVTSCCIADIDGDMMQEVVMGTREGGVHVLRMSFNREEDAGSEVYSSLSAAHSRPSTPVVGEHGLELAGESLAQEEDEIDARSRPPRRPSEHSMDRSEPHMLAHRQSMATPDKTITPGVVPPSVEPVPLSPHLKTLVEIKAQDAVTSLSIVYVPETPNVLPSSTLSRADSAGADAAEEAAAAAAVAPGEYGNELGDHVSSMTREGSNQEVTEAEKVEIASAAGVYVAAGLETGVVEVIRLSSRREGTRVFDLVRASERSDRMSSSLDAQAASRSVDEKPDNTGEAPGDGKVGGNRDANDRPRDDSESSPSGGKGERNVSPQGIGTADDRTARPLLDREGSGLVDQSAALPGAATASTSGPMASILCRWHVPAACKSSESWIGRGLVVGFLDTGLGTPPFAGTPRTPLDRGFGKAPRWGWGKAGEGTGGRSGGRAAGGGGQQVFAVCTMDGCVRCCQVVSNAERQPRWKNLWTRQTKEALHSFQRLDVPSGLDDHGQADEGDESLLVVCSWSGNTFIFDAEGTPCLAFDAGAHLEGPLTAFVAGDLTTPSGTTGPSLVYLDTGGRVMAYHGLMEQTESMSPAQQFIPKLQQDGSIDTLTDLLKSLANRLEWRSNQADLLFPSAASAPEANAAADDSQGDGTAGDTSETTASAPFAPSAAAALAAGASAFSDDEQDVALSLPDEILARAVLCPPGVVVALAKTTRRDDRKKTTADGVGGNDDYRWHREVRALAEGRESTITVGEGAAAVDRVLREIKAWETRGREPTLKNFPCFRGTVEALTSWGSGPCRESLRRAVKKSEAKTEFFGSPG
eukprot:g11062.t1